MFGILEKKNSKQEDWAKTYRAVNFLEKGVCTYNDEVVYLSQETLASCARGFKGRPVIIKHQRGITPENMKEHAVGYVTNCEFDQFNASFSCDFVIFDDEAKKKIAEGWSVSCAYVPTAFAAGGTWHNTTYDREITALDFTHLALVPDPRYEEAKVYENAKFSEEDGRWITINSHKGDDGEGGGTHIFIKNGETLQQAMDRQFGKKETKEPEPKKKETKEKELKKKSLDYEDIDDRLDRLDERAEKIEADIKKEGKFVDAYHRERVKGYKEELTAIEAKRKKLSDEYNDYLKESEDFETKKKEEPKTKEMDSKKAIDNAVKSALANGNVKPKNFADNVAAFALGKTSSEFTDADKEKAAKIQEAVEEYLKAVYDKNDVSKISIDRDHTDFLLDEVFTDEVDEIMKKSADDISITDDKGKEVLKVEDKPKAKKVEKKEKSAKREIKKAGELADLEMGHLRNYVYKNEDLDKLHALIKDTPFDAQKMANAINRSDLTFYHWTPDYSNKDDSYIKLEATDGYGNHRSMSISSRYNLKNIDKGAFDLDVSSNAGAPDRTLYPNADDYEHAILKWALPSSNRMQGLAGSGQVPPSMSKYTNKNDFSKAVNDWLTYEGGASNDIKKEIRTRYLQAIDKATGKSEYSQFYKGFKGKLAQNKNVKLTPTYNLSQRELANLPDNTQLVSKTSEGNYVVYNKTDAWDWSAKALKPDGSISTISGIRRDNLEKRKFIAAPQFVQDHFDGRFHQKSKEKATTKKQAGVKSFSRKDIMNMPKGTMLVRSNKAGDKFVVYTKVEHHPMGYWTVEGIDKKTKKISRYSGVNYEGMPTEDFVEAPDFVKNTLKGSYYKIKEKHNSKEDDMNVEEFFNKMGEVFEEKFNACKKNEAEDDDIETDDDELEYEGEKYSKKELVNAFKKVKKNEADGKDDEKEKDNEEDAEAEKKKLEEEKENALQTYKALEEKLNHRESVKFEKAKVYSQKEGLARGKEIFG